MFNQKILEQVEADLSARRKREEELARSREREVEEKNEALRLLGLEKRALGPRILGESLKGGSDLKERIEKIQARHEQIVEEYAHLLEKMGLPRDYTKTKVSCKLCQDTGYFEGKMCPCLKKAAVLEGYRASGIGKLLEKQRFDNFDLSFYSQNLLPDKRFSPRDVMEEILNFCKDYAE
ncbi:MAG: hypothetical protein IKU24_00960, partial [Clostridia bacterium]|nr:hypothetical protein [Clostridia bacterium]